MCSDTFGAGLPGGLIRGVSRKERKGLEVRRKKVSLRLDSLRLCVKRCLCETFHQLS